MSLEIEYGDDVFCDLQEAGCYLRRRNPEAGCRFTRAAQKTFEFLSKNPLLGRPRPELGVENIRSCPVEGFRRYLIFYLPTDARVRILRVLHGSRDLSAEFNP
jgi:toxin ParE1/3/4